MFFNKLDDDERIVAQVEHPKTGNTVEKVLNEHMYTKRLLFTGKLDDKIVLEDLPKIATKGNYVQHFGAKNNAKCQTYFSCNKRSPMCLECYTKHMIDMGMKGQQIPIVGFK